MRRSHQHVLYSSSCGCCQVTRRGFLAGCAGCAVSLGTRLDALAAARGQRPRVRVVFCQPRNDRPTWPNIGYDYVTREKQMLETLIGGVPNVDFLPTRMIDQSAKQAGVLAADGEVDGYVVCLLGLGWSYGFDEIAALGKPMLVVDNLFGGSGMFLTRMGPVMAKHPHVDWVSSSNEQDLVSSARHFVLLQEGRSPQEVAAAFRATR